MFVFWNMNDHNSYDCHGATPYPSGRSRVWQRPHEALWPETFVRRNSKSCYSPHAGGPDGCCTAATFPLQIARVSLPGKFFICPLDLPGILRCGNDRLSMRPYEAAPVQVFQKRAVFY